MSDKPYITQPTTRTDLEARAKRDFATVAEVDVDPNKVDSPYVVEDNDTSAYVGVDADRMTYANDTEKPLRGDGIEDDQQDEMLSGLAFGKDEKRKGEQTVGSGSSAPSVFAVTSGEDVSTAIVDRKKLASETEKATKAGKTAPLPERLGAVSRPEPVAKEEDEEEETPTPRQQGGGTPPPAQQSGGTTPPAPPAPPARPATPPASS